MFIHLALPALGFRLVGCPSDTIPGIRNVDPRADIICHDDGDQPDAIPALQHPGGAEVRRPARWADPSGHRVHRPEDRGGRRAARLRHRSSNKRRSWRKLHLAVRDGGIIEASVLTDSGADDSTVGEDLLEKIVVPVASFGGDGAYDSRAFYAALGRAGTLDIDILIPPQRKASPSRPAEGTWQQRNEATDRSEQVGRRQWRKESGAHRQARGPPRPADTPCSATNGSSATFCEHEHSRGRRKRR